MFLVSVWTAPKSLVLAVVFNTLYHIYSHFLDTHRFRPTKSVWEKCADALWAYLLVRKQYTKDLKSHYFAHTYTEWTAAMLWGDKEWTNNKLRRFNWRFVHFIKCGEYSSFRNEYLLHRKLSNYRKPPNAWNITYSTYTYMSRWFAYSTCAKTAPSWSL